MSLEDDQKAEVIYRLNQRFDMGYVETLAVIIGNVLRSKDLIWQLYKRDFFGSYKKSFFGVGWALFSPVIGMATWVFLRKAGILAPGDVGIPYIAYVLIGTSMWGLFMGFFQTARRTLSSTSMIISYVNFPHEVVLVKQALMNMSNFAATFVLNVIVMVAFGVVPSPWAVLFPLVILPLFFLGAAIGLIVALVAVVSFDTGRIIEAFIKLLMFATPVIYAKNLKVEWMQEIIKWNPLTYLVCSARDIIIYGRLYDATGYFVCATLSFVLFCATLRLFYVTEDRVVERML